MLSWQATEYVCFNGPHLDIASFPGLEEKLSRHFSMRVAEPLSIFSSLHAQHASPHTRTTELHLETLSCRFIRTIFYPERPSMDACLVAYSASDFSARLHEGGETHVEVQDFEHLIECAFARAEDYDDSLMKIVNSTATISEDRTTAEVWVLYHARACGQTIHREMVTRLLWRHDASNGAWLCHEYDFIRGPGLHGKRAIDVGLLSF
jgi:hypothetical protein